MRPALRRARSLARHVPGVPRARREMWERRSVEAVAASGLFDESWYRLQTGRDDLAGRAAVEDYVRRGRRVGLSPAPFFEPSTFDKLWRKRVEDPFSLFLRDGALRRSARWHPVVTFPAGDLRRGDGGALLPPAPDEQVLLQHDEGAPATVTWAEARGALLDRASTWRRQEDARAGSVRSRDRPAQEASFRAAMARQEDPPVQGGEVLVSVVMPTWNRQGLVGRSVRSVQEQGLHDWELVVADDGSTDDTSAVLEGISHFDSRVRVLHLPHTGVSHARNEAIRAARGRYVAFLDSDNTWQPDFLELMVKGLEATGAEAAFSSIEMVSSRGTDYRVGSGRREDLLVGNHVDLNALVVRREALALTGGFDESLRRTVDYDLVLKLSERQDLRFLPFVGVVYDDEDAAGTANRISVREPLTWDYVVRARHVLDWPRLAGRPRVQGRTSVVLTTGSPGWSTNQSLRSVLEQDVAGTVEVVVVDRGGSRTGALALGLWELVDRRVRVVRTAVDVGVPLALDVALGEVTGETVVMLTPGLVLEPGALAGVVAALETGASSAQLVALDVKDLLAGAGAVLPRPGLPVPLVTGHPVSELDGGPSVLPVPAVYGGGLAARTSDVLDARGLDPLLAGELALTDLSLRLADAVGTSPATAVGARCRVVGKSWVGPLAGTDLAVFRARNAHRPVDTGAVAELGLDLPALATRTTGSGSSEVVPVLLRSSRRAVQEGPAAGLPSLRWSLVTAAPAGPRGRSWGDKHFAEALARSLRRLGQDAHVYAREAHDRPSAHLDDVRLVLRGLDPVVADPGRPTITWVISHPDAVDDAELVASDAVFAAGRPWAQAAERRTGRPVGFLPQCTDPQLFRPGAQAPARSPDRLFVGNSRGVARPSVAALVSAGVDLAVYGGGWEDLVPSPVLAGAYLPNDELGQAYWDAGVVLNDHWADMREHGFISNRVFDAVAAGGRVISDHVDGLDDLLPGVVQTWRTPAQLVELATRSPFDLFGTDAERRERAAAVSREHSFDARALELVRKATDLTA